MKIRMTFLCMLLSVLNIDVNDLLKDMYKNFKK